MGRFRVTLRDLVVAFNLGCSYVCMPFIQTIILASIIIRSIIEYCECLVLKKNKTLIYYKHSMSGTHEQTTK